MEEDQEEEKKPHYILATVIFILIVTYIFAAYPIGNIIRGQLESNPLNNDLIELKDFSIKFLNETQKELQEIYFNEQKVEFSVCLIGEKIDKNYYIKSLYKPKMYEQRFNQVVFEPCSEQTIIVLHSHPYKSCLASKQDLESMKKSNKTILIMCEPGRFSVYTN